MPKPYRILLDLEIEGVKYKANQVVNLSEDTAKPHLEAKAIDDNEDAVEHCIDELGAEPVDHVAVVSPKSAAAKKRAARRTA